MACDFAEDLKGAIEAARSAASQLNIYPYACLMKIRRFPSDSRPGLTNDYVDENIPLGYGINDTDNTSGYNPIAKLVKSSEAVLSGGVYRQQTFKITFTKAYSGTCGSGGIDFDSLLPNTPLNGTLQVFIKLFGPGVNPRSPWYQISEIDNDSFHSTIVTVQSTNITISG